jgi:hypothetical protein
MVDILRAPITALTTGHHSGTHYAGVPANATAPLPGRARQLLFCPLRARQELAEFERVPRAGLGVRGPQGVAPPGVSYTAKASRHIPSIATGYPQGARAATCDLLPPRVCTGNIAGKKHGMGKDRSHCGRDRPPRCGSGAG